MKNEGNVTEMRCTECDCENGGDECNWFKTGPLTQDTSSDTVEQLIQHALAWKELDIMAGYEASAEDMGKFALTMEALVRERDELLNQLAQY